jgi:hypothetical protein
MKTITLRVNKIKPSLLGYSIATRAGKKGVILFGPILILYLVTHTRTPKYKMLRDYRNILGT